MRAVQDILFGVTGQTIHHDAAEGRPSSVTSVQVFIYDVADTGTSEWSATGTVEAGPSTTVDAASGSGQPDPRVINVTATTNAALDRTYLITGANGFKEWFDVAEIASGASLTARHPLHNAYTTGDTVESTRIQATVDATWVANLNKLRDDTGPNPMYRVRWVYVVSGVTYVADTYFNLVRYAGQHGVRPQNIESLAAGWLDSLPTDHRENQGRTLIDDAYTAVRFDLHGVWTDDSMVANAELIDEVTRYKTIELGEFAKILAGGGDTTRYQVAKDAYQSRLDSLLRITNKAPVRDSSGAAQEKPAIALSRR